LAVATAPNQSGAAIKAMRLVIIKIVNEDFIGQIINYQPMFAHLGQVRRGCSLHGVSRNVKIDDPRRRGGFSANWAKLAKSNGIECWGLYHATS
jgi:hypothetical protein